MSEFKKFADAVSNRFTEIQKRGILFKSSVSGDDLWNTYIKSFKKGDDPVFRDPESTQHTCNLDKNFIRRYGNVVAIDDNMNIITMWDVDLQKDSVYLSSIKKMSSVLKKSPIKDIFFETFDSLKSLPYESCNKNQSIFRLGIETNHKIYNKDEVNKFGVVQEGKVYRFDHFYADLSKEYVDFTGKSIESIMSDHRSNNDVFERGILEIPLATLQLVKDLIKQGSLLDGDAHLWKIDEMIKYKSEFDKSNFKSSTQKSNWFWIKSNNLKIAKFRNELVGTLCVELAEGKELNSACQTWNKRVDPANYMKAVAPITEGQKKEAAKFVSENGYEESFIRRFATIDDINVDEILHSNIGKGEIKTASVFDKLSTTKTDTRYKRSQFDKIEEVGIEKFMKDILPSCTGVEIFLENRMSKNLVALTTADSKDSKKMFKWDNNFSWTFNGNLAGTSQLKEAVASRGGRVDGAFRFSHSWNRLERNESLMDLHVFMPGCEIPKGKSGGPNVTGRRVGWNSRRDYASGGNQDVDYTSKAPLNYVPVENITFPEVSRMPEGVYRCFIHNWSFRSSGGRGEAEIAFGDEIYSYVYPETQNHEWVEIARVTLRNGLFTIQHVIEPSDQQSNKIWNIDSNHFHKVNLVCLSPNHWGNNNTGNKYYMFMIEGCKTDVPIRSFHSENLNSELTKHRKVIDVLGQVTMLEPSKNQLCGLGFNSTVRDEVILKLSGTHKRTLKIKF